MVSNVRKCVINARYSSQNSSSVEGTPVGWQVLYRDEHAILCILTWLSRSEVSLHSGLPMSSSQAYMLGINYTNLLPDIRTLCQKCKLQVSYRAFLHTVSYIRLSSPTLMWTAHKVALACKRLYYSHPALTGKWPTTRAPLPCLRRSISYKISY